MREIVLVGGKLQGMEASYLAREAGIRTVLIDADPSVPARNLCDEFICTDILFWGENVREAVSRADMVLPTLENDEVLEFLTEKSAEENFVLAFDMDAYRISSSKILSDKLFHDNDIPSPVYYPGGHAPYIVKPEFGSGSHDIKVFNGEKELKEFLGSSEERLVVQEFITGPSYSMEVIGVPGNYRTYASTEIFVAGDRDCNLVTAYQDLTDAQMDELSGLILKIAEILKLKGVMDIEVILSDGVMKVLEIDARLPSQTPIAVYYSSGVNYIEEIYDLFCDGAFRPLNENVRRCASLEQYLHEGSRVSREGEHIMVEGRPLRYSKGFCGAFDAMTDYDEKCELWRTTIICVGDTAEEVEAQRRAVFHTVCRM